MEGFTEQLLIADSITGILFASGFVFGLVYRQLLRLIARGRSRGVARNIGTSDRWFRALLGVLLLVWAIETTWNPWILFLSGFCFFEAIFSWCGFYAALGRNTCPTA